ncbi:MAG: hypothetical protein D4R67_00250 [Bacteroidetes bacterium]|nr:MAG: hypothetical protein D4R67_00250 [Bacteroidota bacterium]
MEAFKGLLATANDGDLPPFMAKTNKYGIQKNILIIQGCIVTCISLIFLVMPTVSSAFFILFVIGFFPPAQLEIGSPAFYVWFLIGGVALFVLIPVIIGYIKKPEWKTKSGTE